MYYVLSIVIITTVLLILAIELSRSSRGKQHNLRRSNRPDRKQAAIRIHSQQLGTKLRERYGVRDKYPPDKIKTTIAESGWSSDRDCYGIAMYSDRNDFIEYHRSIGESCDYDAMRSEIGECLSLPDNTFSTSEAIAAGELFTDRGGSIDASNSSSDDGGSGWSWSGGDSGADGSSNSSDGGSYDGGGGGDSDSSSSD